MPTVKLLSRKDVESLLSMEEAISVLEEAFVELAEGRVIMPQRTAVKNNDVEGVSLFMPAFIPKISALGTKIVTVYNKNPTKHNLPAVMATVILLDPETGAPISIMEAGFLTAIRTGAVSGVATKYLARPDAKVHTIIGTGIQAKTQAWAVSKVRDVNECIVFSLDPKEAQMSFCQNVEALTKVPTRIADDKETAVKNADILTLATSASQPVIDGHWIKEGTHINGIGSHSPTML